MKSKLLLIVTCRSRALVWTAWDISGTNCKQNSCILVLDKGFLWRLSLCVLDTALINMYDGQQNQLRPRPFCALVSQHMPLRYFIHSSQTTTESPCFCTLLNKHALVLILYINHYHYCIIIIALQTPYFLGKRMHTCVLAACARGSGRTVAAGPVVGGFSPACASSLRLIILHCARMSSSGFTGFFVRFITNGSFSKTEIHIKRRK